MKTPTPFEQDKVNIGGAMNLSSGVFTTPRSGRYFFLLTGVVKFSSNSAGYIRVAFRLNACPIGRGHTEGNVGTKGYQTFSLQSTFNMKARYEVWLEIDYIGFAELHEDAYKRTSLHYAHFTGWLMQEDHNSGV